ncbi:MAG: CRTAC1 family protein, partial [Thermomicrobiales bacterium]
ADLYVTNVHAGNKLLMNNGNETFSDLTLATGTGSYEVGWATAFLDFDHDMVLDLYVSNQNAANRLYHGTPGGTWPDVGPALGVASPESSYCFALADIDTDGDLDILVQRHAAPLALYINHEGELHSWAKFNVVGQGHNRFAIGAQIDVTAGGVTQMREVHAGANHKSHNELILHVGLAEETLITEVQVLWPGGDTRLIRNLPANQTHDIYPPERLGDMNCDAVIGVGDIGFFVTALTNPEQYSTLNPGCPRDLADVNNDGTVSVADIGAFVARIIGS